MKITLNVILFWTTFQETVLSVNALKCWKCIAHDCNADLEKNYKASKVKCHEGQMCMKVWYKWFDNVTHYESVIRTCTDSACDKSSMDEFLSCVSNPAKYIIGGCTLRSCCSDKDFCNSARILLTVPYALLVAFSVYLI